VSRLLRRAGGAVASVPDLPDRSIVQSHSRATLAAAVLALAVIPARPLEAQEVPAASSARQSYEVGGELESYLRSLQALGDVPVHPWSLRGFSPVELERLSVVDSAHVWSTRFDLAPRERPRFEAWLAPARVGTRINSGFAFSSNDGAVWAGRGLTASLQAGAGLRWGPLTVTVAPLVFWTENRAFPLMPNGREGDAAFGDGIYPLVVDRPRRFGDGSYARIDAGDSEIRLDAFGASVGFSNVHEWWGPAQRFPFLLGTNAAGFPHVFAGTSRPANLWLVKAHARVLWGRLEQSEYFEPVGITRPRRFVTGLLAVVQPRGLENLELGLARFIHAPWPDEGLPNRYITRAFEGILKTSISPVDDPISGDERSSDGENQLGSVFGRFVVPGSGFEIYGEFAREDHPWDMRYLLLNPDEQASLTVGARKSWRRGPSGLVVVRGESINFQENSVSRTRGGRAFYGHASGSNQGHTQRGQLLGADVGVGSAAGAFLGLDLVGRDGRWTLDWQRIVRQEEEIAMPEEGGSRDALDVEHSIGVERLLFTRRLDITAGLSWTYDFNRDFDRDRQNLSVAISVAARR
jgi:hypothetical protein